MTRSTALLAAALLCQACADHLNLGGQTSGTGGNTGTATGGSTGGTAGTTGTNLQFGCSLSVSQTTVAFGDVVVGGSPQTQQVTFTNLCTQQAVEVAVTATQTAPEFDISDASGPVSGTLHTLPPGGSYAISIGFTPDAAGAVISELQYTGCVNQTTCVAPQSITLTGTGTTASLSLSPSAVAFPVAQAGNTASQTVTLSNTGNDAAIVSCIYLQSLGNQACGQASAQFSIGQPSDSLPATLGPGASLTLSVTYTASVGPASDTLAVDYTPQGATAASTATDPLSGRVASTIAFVSGTPQILVVQDASGSMCEPIQSNVSLNAETGCATDVTQSKAGLVTATMETVLDALDPGALQLGLYALPDKVDGNAGQCQAATQATYPLEDAATTLPQLLSWYQGLNDAIGGGTPTAQTLTNALPLFASAGSGPKYVVLITDGLPNCDDDNPCVTDPSANLWSDGEAHGCESQSFENLFASKYAEPTNATPPAQCQCSEGTCTNPDAGNASADCCVIDPQLLSPSSSNVAFASEDCLDTSNTVSAIQNLAANGITTYVVGVGYDFAYAPQVFTTMAQAGAGGQADAGFYDVQSSETLLSSLSGLFDQMARPCAYVLSQNVSDPSQLWVTLDGASLSLNTPDGFTFTPPNILNLSGSACTAAEDGGTNSLSVSQ